MTSGPATQVGEAPRRRGRVITFYSYKGGVGRSMALANIAALLARKKRRVLVIDWDLEAPGIEKYFEPDTGNARPRAARTNVMAAKRKTTDGLVDLITAFAAGEARDWRQALMSATVPGGEPIAILSAGRDCKEYAGKLRRLDWQRLFDEQDLGDHLEGLRRQWIADYDFVLIDSRTGITDIGGMCTILLPDVLVALFTANEQSLFGIKQVMNEAVAAQASLPLDRFRLQLVPVPSRDESLTEHENAAAWRDIFAEELKDLMMTWLPKYLTPREALMRLKIPHKAYWSFGERLPVVVEGTSDPASVGHAYNTLAELLANDLSWEAATDASSRIAAATQKAEEVTAAADSRVAAANVKAEQATAAASSWATEKVKEADAKAARTLRRTRRMLIAGAVLTALVLTVVVSSVGGRVKPDRLPADINLPVEGDDPLVAALALLQHKADALPADKLAAAAEMTAWLPRAVLLHPVDVADAVFSPDGSLIATTGRDNTVRLWRSDGRGVPLSLIGHAGSVTSATFSRDGKQLVTTSVDETARLWTTATGQELAKLQHVDAVYSAAFAPKEERLATATRQRLYLWDAPRGAKEPEVTLDVGLSVEGLAYPTPESVIVVKATGKIEAWSLAKRRATPFFDSGVSDSMRAFDISPSLTRIGTASPDRGYLRVWRLDNPQRLPFFTRRVAPVAALAVGDAVVADVLLDGAVEVWRGDDHDRPAVMGRHSGNVRSMDISMGGALVVVGSDNGVALWNVAAAKRLFGLDGGPAVTVVRFDSAGGRFLTVEAAGQVRVWPVQPAAPAPTWDALLRRNREATTACLGVQDRQRMLGEDATQANDEFAACERSFGRRPRSRKTMPAAAN